MTLPAPARSIPADPAHPRCAPLPIAGALPVAAGAPGLSAAELAHFHERGWVLRRGLVDRAGIAALRAEIDGLHQRMDAVPEAEGVHVSWEDGVVPRRIRQLMGSELVSSHVDAISRSEPVLAILRQLIGPDVLLYHSKLMMKAAGDGSFTPWHQDYQYWVHESFRPTQVNCMLSIDASDEANGALRMVDGSHRLGLLAPTRINSSSFSIGLPGDLAAWPSTLIETKPGDAVFFGAYVVHGSGPNASSRDRRANTFAFDAPGNWRPGVGGMQQLPAERWRCGRRS